MHCKSCEMLVKDALEAQGAKNIKILLNTTTQTGIVSCEADVSKQQLIDAIGKEGYKAS